MQLSAYWAIFKCETRIPSLFFVRDTQKSRHERIRLFDGSDITIGVLLSAADFEWTVRRAIVAAGTHKNKTIKEGSLRKASSPSVYWKAWHAEVFPRFGVDLDDIILEWEFFKDEAFKLRNKIIHGEQGTAGIEYAKERRDCILRASVSIVEFSAEKGCNIYERLAVRRKDLHL